jgi:TPR repeat protein
MTITTADVTAFRQRAEQGDAWAQHELGLSYRSGDGVQKDETQARQWFRKAAEQGIAEAQYYIGFAHQFDEDEGLTAGLRNRLVSGIYTDYVEAVVWYRKAAEQGYAAAQYCLGSMYSTGQGIPQDYVEAHKWFNLAAAHERDGVGNRHAEARDEVAKRMTPAQLADAQKLAREWQAAFDARQK